MLLDKRNILSNAAKKKNCDEVNVVQKPLSLTALVLVTGRSRSIGRSLLFLQALGITLHFDMHCYCSPLGVPQKKQRVNHNAV
jgi:hypothetical protein